MHRAHGYGLAVVGFAVAFGAASGRSVAEEMAAEGSADCHEAGVTLTFDVGSTAINDRGRTSLNGVAKWLNADESRTVRAEGYADKTGNETLNQELSEQRAQSAKEYLVGKGIDGKRIATEGHGENTERADLKNTRAVAVFACTPTTAEETPPPAAEPVETAPPPPPPPTNVAVNVMPAPPPAEKPSEKLPPSQVGVQAMVGGYATGFVEGGARSLTDTGGSWDGRLTVGTRLPVAVEAAYVGSAQGINALGLNNTNAFLMGNGAEGDLRINMSTTRIQPYIFGGAGWMRYQIENTNAATASVAGPDNVLTVPFGVGISGRLGRGFVLDVRGTGRATFEDQILNTMGAASGTTSGGTRMHSWNAGARLGWEF